MTDLENLRSLVKLLKPLAARARRDKFGAITIASVESNPFAYGLENAIALAQAARDAQGKIERELTAIALDAAPVSFTTDWRGHDVQHATELPEEL